MNNSNSYFAPFQRYGGLLVQFSLSTWGCLAFVAGEPFRMRNLASTKHPSTRVSYTRAVSNDLRRHTFPFASNSLPSEVRDPTLSCDIFRSTLKTHLLPCRTGTSSAFGAPIRNALYTDAIVIDIKGRFEITGSSVRTLSVGLL